MPITLELLQDALAQFRLDVIEALTSIDVEVNALQQAIKEGKSISPKRLKQLRVKSRTETLHKFRDYYAQHISLAHEPRQAQ
jgi:hypothetical protein